MSSVAAVSTEEIAPGYKVSTASYVVSLLLPEIVEDLQLKRHGYKTLPRNPSAFTPFDDGRYLFLGPDQKANYEEIKKFSEHDARAFAEYEAFLERVAEQIESALNLRSSRFAAAAILLAADLIAEAVDRSEGWLGDCNGR